MLETTLSTQPTGESLAFELTVKNHGEEAVELSFSDAQRVRVSVYSADAATDDAPRWRSDEGQLFAQISGTETVPAGSSNQFETAWKTPDSGEYRVVGEVTCQEHSLQDELTFLV